MKSLKKYKSFIFNNIDQKGVNFAQYITVSPELIENQLLKKQLNSSKLVVMLQIAAIKF